MHNNFVYLNPSSEMDLFGIIPFVDGSTSTHLNHATLRFVSTYSYGNLLADQNSTQGNHEVLAN